MSENVDPSYFAEDSNLQIGTSPPAPLMWNNVRFLGSLDGSMVALLELSLIANSAALSGEWGTSGAVVGQLWGTLVSIIWELASCSNSRVKISVWP